LQEQRKPKIGMKTLGDFGDYLDLGLTQQWRCRRPAVCVSASGRRASGRRATARTREAREGGNWQGALAT